MEQMQSNPGESMSLLQNLIEHPLDDDYYAVDRKQGEHPGRARGATVIALVGFALLVTIAAVQTRIDKPAADTERAGLIKQIAAQKKSVRTKQAGLAAVSEQVHQLQSTRADPTATKRYESQQVVAGSVAVEGPGIKIVVDNAKNADQTTAGRVQDKDLQVLVNGLWRAGAEAVAINDNRLSTLSSIRTAGEAITVNYKSLARPYAVKAIGDPDTMQSRFLDTAGGQTWTGLHANLDMRFDVTQANRLTLPATPKKRLVLLETSPLQEEP